MVSERTVPKDTKERSESYGNGFCSTVSDGKQEPFPRFITVFIPAIRPLRPALLLPAVRTF